MHKPAVTNVEIADNTSDLLKLPAKRLSGKDLPKSIRLPLNTHTAASAIATLESKRLYEVVTDAIEKYISDMPLDQRQTIRTSIETVEKASKQ